MDHGDQRYSIGVWSCAYLSQVTQCEHFTPSQIYECLHDNLGLQEVGGVNQRYSLVNSSHFLFPNPNSLSATDFTSLSHFQFGLAQ